MSEQKTRQGIFEQDGVLFEDLVDYKGREYDRFTVDRPLIGTGWVVKGYAREVSATVIKLMARPDLPFRKTPRFNSRVMIGWKTKRKAQQVADYMNQQLKKEKTGWAFQVTGS